MAMNPAVHPERFPDHTRTEAAMQVRQVSHAPDSGLEGLICQAILRARRERQAREAAMQARFGCVRQAEREAGG